MNQLFEKAKQAFEKACAEDPNFLISDDGQSLPAELVFGMRLTKWINILMPNAPDFLVLAAMSQHLYRWKTPRTSFPEGRTSYLKWRAQMAVFHAENGAKILKEVGYDDDFIDKVHDINRKKGIKTDLYAQTMEDALCLEFLEYQINDFVLKHDEEMMLGIITKTWNKMSDNGHAEALKLKYSDRAGELIGIALK